MTSTLMGHLVGDYLLQNDWMALKKKGSTTICAIHCAVWATSVCLFAGWAPWTWPALWAAHFVQDRTGIVLRYMNMIGQRQFATGACAPWSIIVVDNVFHLLAVWLISLAAS